jgi:hypothetical protein
MERDSGLAFIILLPLIWVLWFYVHPLLLHNPCDLLLTSLPRADDRVQADHYIPYIPNLLQLPSNVLFRWCSELPGQMASGPMYVLSSKASSATLNVSAAGLTGFTLFITIAGMFLSTFMLLVPVIYEKYDKLMAVARLMKEVRVGFILTGTGTVVSLLIS